MKFRPLKDKPKEKKPKNTWEDHYTRKAKKEDYPARSVYKLQEIQRKFTLIKKNDRVLDLGCFPGSWLLYAAELTGPGGRVNGIDLKQVTVSLPPHAKAVAGDILEPGEDASSILKEKYRVVISDMAPATTGMKDVDAARSFELSSMALTVAEDVLEPGGAFVCKIFQGEDMEAFTAKVKELF
jgi:23S rRNA (uridine2552-2'-O)-methyltransferase